MSTVRLKLVVEQLQAKLEVAGSFVQLTIIFEGHIFDFTIHKYRVPVVKRHERHVGAIWEVHHLDVLSAVLYLVNAAIVGQIGLGVQTKLLATG